MDADSLNDVAIVSVTGAARLGRVSDVLFATDPLRIAALKATGEPNEVILPFDQVSNFGSDAVMVESPDVTQLSRQGGSFSQLRSLTELKKLKVVDQAGTYVGTIRTVDFDPETGRVNRLVVGSGGVLGMGGRNTTIEGEAVLSVGSDLLTIASGPEAAVSSD